MAMESISTESDSTSEVLRTVKERPLAVDNGVDGQAFSKEQNTVVDETGEAVLDENLEADSQSNYDPNQSTYDAQTTEIFGSGSIRPGLLDAHYTNLTQNNLNSNWNLNPGPGRTLNGIIYDADGKPINVDGSPASADDIDEFVEMFEEVKRRDEERRRDQEATLSEQQIDAMAWVGDPDEVWTVGDMSVSRKSILAGAKSARAKIKDMVASGEMTEAEGAHETRLLSDYEIATKNDDAPGAAEIRKQMTPGTQQLADQGARTAEAKAKGVTKDTAYQATSMAQKMSASTDAGADFLSQQAAGQDSDSPKAVRKDIPRRDTGLSNPPDIELTKDFAVAADPISPNPTPSPAPVALAQATPVVTAKLSQNFDI